MAAQRAINWTSVSTILSAGILIGTELLGAAWASGWAIAGLFELGPENIRRHAYLIEINAVRSDAMPPGNITEMTPQERQILAAWLAAGAPAK